MKPRVFSGITPSGIPTVGNYFGAIQHWVADQDRFDNIFCVVDLHGLTQPRDPEELRQNTWITAGVLLAAGIDPSRSLLFLQSHVREHSALTWLLNCITPTGWLNRMTQFKVKAGEERESASAGLYDYPVLMAADILLYHTQYVPVGEDQKQHVELTRDVAEKFNRTFGETFTVPQPSIPPLGARIMSLDDPNTKMDKSRPEGAISLLDPPDVIRKKISRAVTDSLGVVKFDPQQPGLYNLLMMIHLLSGEPQTEIEGRLQTGGYKAVKDELADRLIERLSPLQAKFNEFKEHPENVDLILKDGAERARELSSQVLSQVEEKMGLLRQSRIPTTV